LFPGPSGEPAASFYPGDRDPDSFLLATSGLPSQLSEGFVGLLQISHGFFYQPLPKQNAIHGFIIGRSSIGGYGFMVIGTINSLQSIVLLPHDRNPITCTFEGITSEDPSAAAWDFECPINFLQPGQKFSLPIRIEFSTTDGTNHSTRGILIGEWMEGNRQLFLPPPTSLMEVINSYEPAVQILKSHPLTQLEYVGVISAGEKDTYIGEAILLGKARVDGQTLRYSIGTPFIIENGEVKHWALTYETLTQLIADVMQQPFIQRAVEVIPDLGIKLWYAEKVESPEMPTIFNANLSMHFFAEIGHCGKTPLTKLPSDGSPLRGFSLEVGRFRGDPQFVLLPDGLFVHELDLRPAEDAQNPILPLLVPPELDTGDNAPFERIWFQWKSFFQDQPELTLWAPKNINPIITSPYRELIESLPFILKESTKGVLGAKYVTLVFTENGTSKLVACSTR
jgi:hypothetical protein